eukprot:6206546-Pleurochrysis_carterae.AAC.8
MARYTSYEVVRLDPWTERGMRTSLSLSSSSSIEGGTTGDCKMSSNVTTSPLESLNLPWMRRACRTMT